MSIKYNVDVLPQHPAFDEWRKVLSFKNPPEPNEFIKILINAKSDISILLSAMYELAHNIRAKTILELGVRWGNSTILWLIYCHYNGAQLYSVDIDDGHVAKGIIDALGLTKYWAFTQMNDIQYAAIWKNRAAKGENITVDLLFIDTDHTYELTTKELDLYSGFIRKDGVILFHDSDMEGVMRGFNDFLKNNSNWVSIDDNKYLPLKGKVIKRIE